MNSVGDASCGLNSSWMPVSSSKPSGEVHMPTKPIINYSQHDCNQRSFFNVHTSNISTVVPSVYPRGVSWGTKSSYCLALLCSVRSRFSLSTQRFSHGQLQDPPTGDTNTNPDELLSTARRVCSLYDRWSSETISTS
jgi:hypothetical protein